MEGNTGAAGDGRKRRRGEQPAVDRLSALPEGLLLHILSFLQMKDAAKTALLSRAWRYLWTSTSCLDFAERYTEPMYWDACVSPAFIGRALILHEGTKIKSFCAAVRQAADETKGYDDDELVRMVDSWFRFALRRGVEHLEFDYLEMDVRGYTLPGGLFTCESLVSLKLRCCRLSLPSQMSMSSLKSLTLSGMGSDDCDLKCMLAGCPSLESLTLEDCSSSIYRDIRVERADSRLKTLKICDYLSFNVDHDYELNISLPGIRTLIICGHFRPYYVAKDFSSIVNATVDFAFCSFLEDDGEYEYLTDLLCRLRYVQELRLSSWCFQVLSLGPSERLWLSPDISTISLDLTLGFLTCELPGIFNVLRSFPKLKFLTIEVMDVIEEGTKDETRYVISKNWSPTVLQQLKVVSIFGLARGICADEEKKTSDEILEKYLNEFEFVQFLLKNSPVLERLTINSTETSDTLRKKNHTPSGFASRLLALPRASPNVLVIIQDI